MDVRVYLWYAPLQLKETDMQIEVVTPSPLGNKIRAEVARLRAEREVQARAMARILGAAAQIADNHDRLIDEVVAVAEADLEQVAKPRRRRKTK